MPDEFYMMFARKINKILESYMIFAEFCKTIARNIFFLGGGVFPRPSSSTPMKQLC